MTPSELDELIEAYESEKKNLEAFIKEALDEGEYYLAAYYRQGFYKVRTTLENLHRLRDPLHNKKVSLEQRIAYWEKVQNDPVLHNYIGDVEEEKNKLQEILSQKSFVVPNENELTDACMTQQGERIMVLNFILYLKSASTLKSEISIVVTF